MFLDFYGLRKQPFGVTPDPEFLYLSNTHREALASVAYGVQAGAGFSAIVAKPGMGKTTLLFALLRHFQNSTQSAFLFDTQCNSKELLRSLLAEFKIQHETNGSDTTALATLRQFLLKSARANQRVLVVVDEAQNLAIPVFETLRLLSNFETPHAKLLHIVLAGQPELGRKLALPELEQLRQRVTMVSRLDVFAPTDIIKYVVHRLKLAGYQGGPLFSPPALGVLVDKSHGVPREINRLCFNAMSLGCALGKRVIDDTLVREVAADLEFGSLLNEQAAQKTPDAETIDALAALFGATLEAPADANSEPRRVAAGQKFPPAESTGAHAFESERPAPKSPEPVCEQQEVETVSQAGRAAESNPVSAWVRFSQRPVATAAALRASLRSAHGRMTASLHSAHGRMTKRLLNLRAKRSTEPAAAQRSRQPEVRRFAVPSNLAAAPAKVFSRAKKSVSALQTILRNASGPVAQQKASQPKPAVVTVVRPPETPGRESSRSGVGRPRFRRFAWPLASLVVAVSTGGGLFLSRGHDWKPELIGVTNFSSRLASDTQKFVAALVAETHKSVGQWLSQQPAAASSGEGQPKLSQDDSGSVAEASEAASQSRLNSATATPVSATPAVESVKSKQRASQAAGQPRGLAAPTVNSRSAKRANASVSFVGAPAGSHFVATSAPPGQMSFGATVSQVAKPPAPEVRIAAKLIKRIDPIYPELARSTDITGSVVLNAHIDETGKVQQVQAISGDPVLARAAMEAVRQWEYQPSSVNGQPRPSDARIAINFSLR